VIGVIGGPPQRRRPSPFPGETCVSTSA